MSGPVSISVAGDGLIGRRHIDSILECTGEAVLHSIVDPAPSARDHAAQLGVPWYPDLTAMIAAGRPDGILLATPNALHVDQGLECIAAGIPTLVEKPIATDVDGARRLVEAAESAGVVLLVGHHRRHNPLIAAARKVIDDGALGRIVAVHGMFWIFKPDEYFDVGWRRQPGAGPVLMNFAHDIDLMRHLCGEVVSVHAVDSNAVRGNPIEETAAIIIRFENGALGTFAVSDTIVAPWSWELTAKENPAYPPTGEACYMIGGTHGSLELPNLRLWTYDGRRGWWESILDEPVSVTPEEPLTRQIRHFVRVIRDGEAPLVPGREGLMTLQVVEAVKRSARTGETVTIAAA